ncbi:UvrD-helicase domain-containing protein [Clostridium sp. Cult2]|uniref:UvrD-helicase domain-containing protein n=1 Tax=Clostridium sp. Cult2 TaxID=2079003 RepID=UPI001F002F59|nr:UvrD-helicase domain-containing protein [Clostridium sp. Cult2]
MKLNLEQRRIVELEPNGHMLVKGVAGSGKTTVAVRRIPFLLHHYCPNEDDKVLLVTFNKTLLNYIKYLYDKAEEENYQLEIFSKNDNNVEITTIDSLMYKIWNTGTTTGGCLPKY